MSRSTIPRHIRAQQKAADLAKIERLVNAVPEREPPADKGPRKTRNLEGDARVMRAIPICAEGVPGTAPGTEPYEETERRMMQAQRNGTIAARPRACRQTTTLT